LNGRIDEVQVRLRGETESVKAGIESIIRNEIATVKSNCDSVIRTQLASAESRIRTETAKESEATLRTLRGEMEKQRSDTNSSFQSGIEKQCASVSAAIRTELVQEREWVIGLVAPVVRHLPLRGSPLDGIIAFLETRCGGNVVDKGIVAVGPAPNPRNVFDFHDVTTIYRHENDPDQWVAVDFKEMRVQVTDYSVQTHVWSGQDDPKSWFLEGSDDGRTWVTLNAQTNRSELRDNSRPSTFSVSISRYCRHLRFRKTEGWQDGSEFLDLTAIEFFGVLTGIS
jgi:hypothetical protein